MNRLRSGEGLGGATPNDHQTVGAGSLLKPPDVLPDLLGQGHLGFAGQQVVRMHMGVTDVDPFILGITQTAGTSTPLRLGAEAVLTDASSNNFVKGIYAYAFAARKTGLQSVCLLAALAALGLAPLFWV